MKHGRLVVIALLVLMLAVGTAVFLSLYERRWTTEWTQDRDEAQSNPFLALETSLNGMGIPASDNEDLAVVLPRLHPNDTLVLYGDITPVLPAQAAALARWVRAGGHIAFQPPYASSSDSDAPDVPLLKALGIEPPASPDESDQDDSKWYSRLQIGAGTVTMARSLDFLVWHNLEEDKARARVWPLLAPGLPPAVAHPRVWLVDPPDTSDSSDGTWFWPLLLQRFWHALLASLLLVLAWAWRKNQRLGPMIPPPPPHRRALLDHIAAVGAMFYRRDRGRTLHRLAAEATRACMTHRFRAAGAEPDDGTAFSPPANPAAFRAAVTALARLWKTR